MEAASSTPTKLGCSGLGRRSTDAGECSSVLHCASVTSLLSSEQSRDSFDTRAESSCQPRDASFSCRTTATDALIASAAGCDDGSLSCDEDLCEQADADSRSPAPGQLGLDAYGPASVDAEVIRNELQRERECPPRRSSSISRETRSRAVSWMVEVATEFGLQPCTMFLSAAYFDRFLVASKIVPPGGLLQLLALACISLATKQEEVQQRPVQQWLSVARDPDGALLFMKDDLLKMEYLVLETLEWRLRLPTAHTFLQLLVPVLSTTDDIPGAEQRQQLASVASFLLELSLLDDRFLDFSYSATAAACLVLAEYLTLNGPANLVTRDLLADFVTVSGETLKACVRFLHELYEQARVPRPAGVLEPVVARFYTQS